MKKKNIKSGALSVTLLLSDGGISVNEVRDAESGKAFLTERGKGCPLFSMTARRLSDGEEVKLSSEKDFTECGMTQAGNDFVLTLGGCSRLPGLTAILSMRCDAAQNRISFQTMLDLQNEEYALISCDYPTLWFDVGESVQFLTPYGSGEVMASDSALYGHRYHSEENYPSYGVSFQFMAVWDKDAGRGIYYGVHDPKPAVKRFQYDREENAPYMMLGANMPLCGIDCGGNGQSLCGECVWQAINGDWYDAAQVYKKWMEKNASWLPKMGKYERADADWLSEIDLWFLVYANEPGFSEPVIRAAKESGVKCAVHLYHWHTNPFDNDYPHYLPVKQFVLEEVRRMQEAGIRVMPYINGRLWDTRDKGIIDWQFTKKALPSATKDEKGKPFVESYSAVEENGEHTVLAVMCPSTALWQDTIVNLAEELFCHSGFDGLYIDQIAAAKAELCMDRSHNHLPGGGSWWVESYNLMTERAARCKKGAVLTTECTAEPFMKHIPGYLSWTWIRNHQVPVFPALYTGMVSTFGIYYHGMQEMDRDGMVIFYMQSLLFGEQLGWITPDMYEVMPEKAFFQKIVSARQVLHNVLSHGVMLRPPKLEDNAPRLHCESSKCAEFGIVESPAVLGAAWMEKETGKRFLILLNGQNVDAKVSLAADKADWKEGDYPLAQLSESLKLREGKAELILPPLCVTWIEA